jgi:hypothetical protein
MYRMARFLLTALLAALIVPASAAASGGRTAAIQASRTHARPSTASARYHKPIQRPSTDPVALSLALAERYWHGVPSCGTPKIVTQPGELARSDYETITSAEPKGSVAEMWTEVQSCTITINAAVWPSWHEDDEFFQWFCDAMTHEVGHLFGHLDSGQTDASSITYPFLDGTSPNFNSVPPCRAITLQYGSEEIRDEAVVPSRR